MSNNPPHGPPPPYYGYPTSGPAPPHPGGYTYVPAPVMMPVYHPQPPPPPPDLVPQPQPTYVTNYIYQQQPQPPPPPQPIHVEVTEVKYESQTSKPWDNVKATAGMGLATVEKGLAWLGNSLQTLNNNNNVNHNRRINSVSVINEELIDWVPATTLDVSSLSHKAFIAGKEGWDGSPLCVIRAHHSGEFIPGKLALKHRSAYVPHAGKEVPVHNFEVLCAPSHAVRWLPSSNGQVPVGAIAAGNTHHGEPLYIARVKHMRSITPGKVHPSHCCCYISFGGSEISYKSYEVLCKIVG